jgi:hypothetical protein
MAPQASLVVPKAGGVNSVNALSECSCASSLYACRDFDSWALAQACYTQCQVSAGYDIHNLDLDKNGVACELELQDVAPLDATPSPQATPSAITQTGGVDPKAPEAVVDAVTGTLPPSNSSPAAEQPPVAAQVALSPAQTTTISISGVATVTTSTIATTQVSTTPVSTTVTTTLPSTAAMAAAPPADGANAIAPPATSLSTVEMLRLLLFSPLGLVALVALIIVGALSLWVAYMLGQRGLAQRQPVTNPDVPEDFTLQPGKEAPVSKA